MTETDSIEEVVKAAQDGEVRAIEELIDRNMDIVYAKSRYFFIKGLDKDDVIQEGRVGLFKAIRDYKEDKEASFRGFAQLCIHRQLVSAIKKANRQKHMPLNNSTSLDKSIDKGESKRTYNEVVSDENHDLEKIFIYQEVLNLIMDKIEKNLTQLEYKVFVKYLDNKTYQEISDELEVNLKSVDNALQRARKKVEEIRENCNLSGVVG
ncbi:RNA polymerase sporulation sigma factor SigH [Halanaerobiaceae bacterium Z-7014]|uniref:RNA polymerase sporulation sigma factor SigH n=1 Tax=Halonatronomonas betaini TaxID=2778430 RepID=A0A931ANS1_9FIRM|nr:RNA polymerase sporulation sigma factor SigH [Halonatronomonas betaini]MBF8435722.1 RNA polymerase sporulation sigma factor SigH [Halonatronomonas betaini]